MFSLALVIFIQIILESLPLSSSGHIYLLENLLKNLGGLKQNLGIACYKSVELAAHLPSAIIFLLFIFLFLVPSVKKFRLNYCTFLLNILLADCITFAMYFFGLKKPFIPLWFGFIITGLIIVLSSILPFKENEEVALDTKKAVILGLAQGVSLQPGVSRLGLTYLTGLFLGFPKNCSLLISFSLAVPLFIGGALKGIYKISISKECYSHVFNMGTICVVTFASLLAFLLLVCLKWLIERNKYWIFFLYLLIPTLLAIFI